MKEDFLHYIWQHQYFDKTLLTSTAGEPLQVLRCGFHNTNAGPDFLQAQVQVGTVIWNGSVEVHLKTSDWLRHHHDLDTRYDQVVLHVVWEDDRVLYRSDGSAIPTLALQRRVNPELVKGYYFFHEEKASIPCGPLTAQVPPLVRLEMLDRVLVERLEQKAHRILELLESNHQDWEYTTYQALCAGFGFKINQEPFQRLSQVLPYSLLRKHQHSLWQLEALLFGQAGFLESRIPEEEHYLLKLQQEFRFLRHKYKLAPGLRQAEWNFLRLRPANFPSVRLAQLAALLYRKEGLFGALMAAGGLEPLLDFFKGQVSEYWQRHYLPARPGAARLQGIGLQSIHILLINTVVPLLFAYSHWLDKPDHREKAMALLEQLPAEKNMTIQIYQDLGLSVPSAADSQAYLQLYQHYCQSRKCLSCSLGHHLLKSHLRT